MSGSGNIARSSWNLHITQSSKNGVMNWRSFSIAARGTVIFDNGTGATLNRVTGNEMSVLDGKLSATGSVYLINPQGVLIGPNGLVTTGGRFVASTLDIDDNAFLAGGPLTLKGTSNGVVINFGKISSSGGDVFLIANKAVANLGTVSAPVGTAELATGTQVLLRDSSSGQQVFVQTGNDGTTLNSGTVRAAQIALQATDGNVYAHAGKQSVVRATGTATRDGHVWLVADGGTVNAQKARISATNADSSGGTVDVSGNTLNINGANVNAARWNLTAPAFTIDCTTGNTLASNLSRGTSVAVTTTGANGSTGDINVHGDLPWNGASTLALNAYHSISLVPSATIANRGHGNLTLRADSTAIDNGGSVTNRGTIDWSASTGIVSVLYDMNGTYAQGTIKSNSVWSAAPFSGLVTQFTPYRLVNSIDDLNAVNVNLAGSYALGTNLDAQGATVSVLGGAKSTPFTGQFDGLGHSINNLNLFGNYQPDLTTADTGLFAVIGTKGVVRNLNVGARAIAYAPVGVLAGENDGLIAHVKTSGSASGETDSNPGVSGPPAGGIVGINRGMIEQSSSSAVLGGSGVATGGAVGANYGTVLQVAATGSIAASGSAGGLVALNAGSVNESYSTGTVGSQAVLGGLVGQNTGTIQQSYTTSAFPVLIGTVGGIAGSNQGAIANDVHWNTDVTQPGPNLGPINGVGTGTPVPASSGFTSAQMANAASFGPTWSFGPGGVWSLPAGATQPVLQWQVAQPAAR
jgi:filamentous hemagglutinin family protein